MCFLFKAIIIILTLNLRRNPTFCDSVDSTDNDSINVHIAAINMTGEQRRYRQIGHVLIMCWALFFLDYDFQIYDSLFSFGFTNNISSQINKIT